MQVIKKKKTNFTRCVYKQYGAANRDEEINSICVLPNNVVHQVNQQINTILFTSRDKNLKSLLNACIAGTSLASIELKC